MLDLFQRHRADQTGKQQTRSEEEPATAPPQTGMSPSGGKRQEQPPLPR
jgi:hypothetical protein